MESLISTFHIDIKLLIAQLINFGVVFAVLYHFAIKPLLKMMESRNAAIEDGLKQAKEAALKMEAAESGYEEMLANARKESQEVLKKAKDDATAKKNELVESAKVEIEQLVNQGKNQLAQEKLAMIEQAKSEVVDLISNGIEKVLSGEIDQKIDNQLIAKYLSKKD